MLHTRTILWRIEYDTSLHKLTDTEVEYVFSFAHNLDMTKLYMQGTKQKTGKFQWPQQNCHEQFVYNISIYTFLKTIKLLKNYLN